MPKNEILISYHPIADPIDVCVAGRMYNLIFTAFRQGAFRGLT